ncbi:hypothetical protein BX666DRAFT_1975692 [Dichotomocladium elegans]|nr:hypothetical protein BX666DRAFT_1975692 [Dichotomocladium elegans]
MGKRKAKRAAPKKLKTTLDSQFNCLFCNHEKAIDCKIDHANKVGHLSCKICDVSWQCNITCKIVSSFVLNPLPKSKPNIDPPTFCFFLKRSR